MPRCASVLAILATVAIAHTAAQDRRTASSEPRPTKNPLEGNRQAISTGGAMFRTRCAGCHGPDARGYLGPDLTGIWAAGYSDDKVFDIVRQLLPEGGISNEFLKANDRQAVFPQAGNHFVLHLGQLCRAGAKLPFARRVVDPAVAKPIGALQEKPVQLLERFASERVLREFRWDDRLFVCHRF